MLTETKSPAIPVTVDNFVRAETDWAFANPIRDQSCFGKFYHFREMTPLDKQGVPRMNRDTLYSVGVFDLDAAGVAVPTLIFYADWVTGLKIG